MQRRDFTTSEIAALLKDVHGAPCRSSYEQGCRCAEHSDGTNAPRVKAHLVAVADESGVAFARSCNGTMTCMCERCSEQRAALVRRPRRVPRQPWEPLGRAA